MEDNYSKNVFINCPFDENYRPLLRTLIFTISYFKFIPRLALEKSDSGQIRLEKILSIIENSQFGIHDLSRIKAAKKNDFFRFNMPFELGADYGCRRFNEQHSKKAFLVLAEEQFSYMKAISDLNGIDIKHHKGNPEELIEQVRAWFIETVSLRNLDGAMKLWRRYNDFQTEIFEARFQKYYRDYDENIAEKMAKNEIDKMPIPEFMDEIKYFVSTL